VLLDTFNLPENLRPYLELYLDMMFELPIIRNGQFIKHEEVVEALERDTVSYSNSIGFGASSFSCGSFSHYVNIEMKLEVSKYELAVRWLKEILYYTKFTRERLKVGTAKLSSDISAFKRKGGYLTRASLNHANFVKQSNYAAVNFMNQQRFLASLTKSLGHNDGAARIINEMESIKNYLCDPQHMRIQVIADFTKVKEPVTPFKNHFIPESFKTKYTQDNKTRFASSYLSPLSSGNQGNILGISAVESAYLIQSTKGPDSFLHPDEAPLLVALEYLTLLEGELWVRLRGKGLCYGFSLNVAIEHSLIYFELSRATHLSQAYLESEAAINAFLSKKIDIIGSTLDSAKSGVLFSVISKEETIESAALQSFIRYLKGLGPNGNKELLRKIQSVTKEDVLRVIEQYLRPLFNPVTSNTSITCNTTKTKEIIATFKEAKRNLNEISIDKFFKSNEKNEK